MVDWNLPMKLGLAGLAAGILGTMALGLLLVFRKEIRASWAFALCLLFSASILTTIGSQVTVVSRLSWGEAEDDPKPFAKP